MADFRKWLFALAVVALLAGLTVPASAQSTTTCNVQQATNNLVRAEGYAELVGDVLLACTGGTPTTPGSPVPAISINIFLSQNVTSRITAPGAAGNFLEALLIIDEPNSTANALANVGINLLNCGSTNAPDLTASSPQSGPGVCTIISTGVVGNSSPNTYNGTPNHPNVFQGRQGQGSNSIVFQGVPFDPPGTTTRFLRFTNVRANANGAGIAQANQTSLITMGIASSGNTVLQLSVQSLAVATVLKGLTTSTVATNLAFAQCNSQIPGLLTASPAPAFGNPNGFNGTAAKNTSAIRFVEGFSSAWKTKNVNYTLTNGTFSASNSADAYSYAINSPISAPLDYNQNVPGVSYNTESGFVHSPTLQNPPQNPPPGFATFGNSSITSVSGVAFPFGNCGGSSPCGNTGISSAGIATQGTRLAVQLANIPNGLSVFVPPVVYLFRQGVTYVTPTTSTGATGVMVLTSTASDGSGVFNPPSLTNPQGNGQSAASLQLVSSTNGAALVVYEILFTDAFSNEYADVPFVVSYSANLNANAPIGLPQPSVIATYAAGFAPFYSTAAATLASATLPIPRFQFTGAAANLFGVVKCSCNLLFPYVTQSPGYDTGIAVANTTADPYGTIPQFGAVQMWYYGTLSNGGAAPGTQCTNVASPGTCPGTTYLSGGQVLTYTLFNGSAQWGLDNRGAGFTGYMIVQTQFQYCHAFAFIGGLGGGPTSGNGLSEGYLALVLDAPSVSRTPATNESLGQ